MTLIGLTAAPFGPAAGADAPPLPEQVFQKALSAATGGPSKADLADQATVRLAEGQLLVPPEAAANLLRATNRPIPPGLLGVLMDQDGLDGMGTLRFVAAGFVDAGTIAPWQPPDILASLDDTLSAENENRRKLSLPPLTARRWIVSPRYDALSHVLTWAPLIVPVTAPADSDGEVTYRSAAFGRDGYIELSFVTSAQGTSERDRSADAFMAGLQFRPGRGYADATASDHRAQSGLAAVMGVTAFRKYRETGTFWSSDRVIPFAGALAATVGALSLTLYTRRIMRHRARRI